jgi:hypothetical protein
MEAELSDRDHEYYFWRLGERTVLTTRLSTPFRGTLSAKLVSHIASRQLRLPHGAQDLAGLVNCNMSREEWWIHVRRESDAANRQVR